MEVREQRDYQVVWRPISLKILNEAAADVDPERRRSQAVGHAGLRIAGALEAAHGNEAVDRFYTAAGEFIHRQRRAAELKADPAAGWATLLGEHGFDPAVAAAIDDESHDAAIRAATELALARTGKDVGTPILTFHPGRPEENSFFGPVISSIPRGEHAVRLWDAVELIATSSGMAELKRSNRAELDFR